MFEQRIGEDEGMSKELSEGRERSMCQAPEAEVCGLSRVSMPGGDEL